MGCLIAARPLFVFMEITERPQLNKLFNDLWVAFFPTKDTHPDDIAHVVANKEWMRDSFIFYGWKPNKYDKLDVTIKFIDGGAVLYHEETPCALISVDQSGDAPKLRITYVDNRAQ